MQMLNINSHTCLHVGIYTIIHVKMHQWRASIHTNMFILMNSYVPRHTLNMYQHEHTHR